MHSYNLRPRRNNNHSNPIPSINQRRQRARALVIFRKPSSGSVPASGHSQYLHKIFATKPILVNGRWCIDAAWHGLDGVYDEPISSLVSAGGYPVIYHLNDIHAANAAFSEYWKRICSPPSQQLRIGQVVLKKHETRYIHVLDTINPDKNYIYPGYTESTIASGKQLRMLATNTSYSCDDIIYVQNNEDIVIFNALNAAKSDYIRRGAQEIFADSLQRSIYIKINVPRGPKHSTNIESMNKFVWDNYVKGTFLCLCCIRILFQFHAFIFVYYTLYRCFR